MSIVYLITEVDKMTETQVFLSNYTNKFIKKLFDNGIISFSAGKDPMRVRFLLPLTILDEHIEEIFSIVEKTVLEIV